MQIKRYKIYEILTNKKPLKSLENQELSNSDSQAEFTSAEENSVFRVEME